MSCPFTMYVFINNSLAMGKGKVAAQCCHAMRYAINELPDRSREINNVWRQWEMYGGKTVTLKAENEIEFKKLTEDYNGVIIEDAGCTQVQPGSKTVCLLFPMKSIDGGFTNKNGKRYQLY